MVENCIVSDDGSKMIQSSSSSYNISNLRDDLLIEILCRLDYSKYATQCKCICKRWLSLINTNPSSNSYFLRRWIQIHSKNNKEREEDEELSVALLAQYLFCGFNHHTIIFSFDSNKKLPILKTLNFIPGQHSPLRVLATFKDLVLYTPCKSDHNVYYICNPFTRQWTALPPPPQHTFCESSVIRAGVIASYDDDGYGFIFKVARVASTFSIDKMIVEIFSSDDREWRQSIVPNVWRQMDVPNAIFSQRLISYTGMMVWMNQEIRYIIGLRINPRDSKADNLFCVSLPLGFRPYQGFLMGVCKGRLRIAQLNNIGGLKLFIWELNSFCQSWEMVHELSLSEIEDSTNSSLARMGYQSENQKFMLSILAFHPHDGDLLYLRFVQPNRRANSEADSRIFVCNVRNRTLKAIGWIPTKDSCIAFPLLLPCWPTQVPLLSNPSY